MWGELFVERLTCHQCNTVIQGEFGLQRLSRLTPEQWAFVEDFLRCEGKLTRLQEELGLSYPTVRSRLNDVIRALGYEVKSSAPGGVGWSVRRCWRRWLPGRLM